MADKAYDPYDLPDQAPMGEGRVTITKGSFGYDATYSGGEQLCAILDGTVDVDGETHEWHKLYSVGSGWEAMDHGSTAKRADGKQRSFLRTTKYGLFVKAAVACDGGEALLRGRGAPQEAAIWDGTMWDMESQDVDYGGEVGIKQVLVPVKFIGEVGKSAGANGNGSSPAATSTSDTANPPAVPITPTAISPATKAKLKKLAKDCPTHDNFVDRAFVEIDGVDGNKYVEGLVADTPLFWEEANA